MSGDCTNRACLPDFFFSGSSQDVCGTFFEELVHMRVILPKTIAF